MVSASLCDSARVLAWRQSAVMIRDFFGCYLLNSRSSARARTYVGCAWLAYNAAFTPPKCTRGQPTKLTFCRRAVVSHNPCTSLALMARFQTCDHALNTAPQAWRRHCWPGLCRALTCIPIPFGRSAECDAAWAIRMLAVPTWHVSALACAIYASCGSDSFVDAHSIMK